MVYGPFQYYIFKDLNDILILFMSFCNNYILNILAGLLLFKVFTFLAQGPIRWFVKKYDSYPLFDFIKNFCNKIGFFIIQNIIALLVCKLATFICLLFINFYNLILDIRLYKEILFEGFTKQNLYIFLCLAFLIVCFPSTILKNFNIYFIKYMCLVFMLISVIYQFFSLRLTSATSFLGLILFILIFLCVIITNEKRILNRAKKLLDDINKKHKEIIDWLMSLTV